MSASSFRVMRVHTKSRLMYGLFCVLVVLIFFFQAEDVIRDLTVTGVQTCVLFFSSRRRHTRFDCDWSSDVCSSDLRLLRSTAFDVDGSSLSSRNVKAFSQVGEKSFLSVSPTWVYRKIGRASCRERV